MTLVARPTETAAQPPTLRSSWQIHRKRFLYPAPCGYLARTIAPPRIVRMLRFHLRRAVRVVPLGESIQRGSRRKAGKASQGRIRSLSSVSHPSHKVKTAVFTARSSTRLLDL